MSQRLVGVRAQLLGSRRALLGLGDSNVDVGPVDRSVETVVGRVQRGFDDVAADVQFVAEALASAAETWRRTERAVGGACA
jgi:hypothetical protein